MQPLSSTVLVSQHQPVLVQSPIRSRVVSPNTSVFRSTTNRPVSYISSRVPELQQQQQQLEEEPNDEVKSDQRFFNFCILVLPFILAVLCLIAGIRIVESRHTSTKSLDGADHVLDFVHHNLKADPIQAIVSTNDQCPNGYKDLKIGKYYGINSGCLCQDGKTYIESYDECLPLIGSGCKYEYGQKSEKLEAWADQKLRYCATYLDDDKWEETATCDQTQNTYCGATVCIEGNKAQCPPNTLSISQSSTSETSASQLSSKSSQNANSQSQFVIRNVNSANKTPATVGTLQYNSSTDLTVNNAFVSLAVSQGTTLCLNKEYAQTDNKIYDLDVQQTQNKVCDQFGALNHEQVVVLDNASQSLILANNDLAGVYTANNLVYYNPSDYSANKYYLLAIKKLPVANKKECNGVFEDYIKDASDISGTSRTAVNVFAWILFAFAIITILLAILFVAAALSKSVASEQKTKVKVARIYWWSAWILVILAVLLFSYYYIFVNGWLSNTEEELQQISNQNCFPKNQGINLAINKLISYDEETRSIYEPLVNEIFIYAIVYTLLWLAIFAYIKSKYPDQ